MVDGVAYLGTFLRSSRLLGLWTGNVYQVVKNIRGVCRDIPILCGNLEDFTYLVLCLGAYIAMHRTTTSFTSLVFTA